MGDNIGMVSDDPGEIFKSTLTTATFGDFKSLTKAVGDQYEASLKPGKGEAVQHVPLPMEPFIDSKTGKIKAVKVSGRQFSRASNPFDPRIIDGLPIAEYRKEIAKLGSKKKITNPLALKEFNEAKTFIKKQYVQASSSPKSRNYLRRKALRKEAVKGRLASNIIQMGRQAVIDKMPDELKTCVDPETGFCARCEHHHEPRTSFAGGLHYELICQRTIMELRPAKNGAASEDGMIVEEEVPVFEQVEIKMDTKAPVINILYAKGCKSYGSDYTPGTYGMTNKCRPEHCRVHHCPNPQLC